jgi:hypothetical protein
MNFAETLKIRNYWMTALLAATTLGVALQMRGAILFFLLYLAPGLIIWTPVTLIRMAIQGRDRMVRAVRLLIWLVTLAASAAILEYRQFADRSNADRVATAVADYKSRTGGYPKDFSVMGSEVARYADRAGVRYDTYSDTIRLQYFDAFIFKKLYEYDFAKGSWTAKFND